jgi:hypothetical protein
MSNPDFFFSRPTSSRVLFFEYSTEHPDFQSDLHEIYRPAAQTELLPHEVALVSSQQNCEVVSLTYDHPSRNPDLVAGVYFDISKNLEPKQAMLAFALAMGYEATEDDIPNLLNHGNAHIIGVGLFPAREALAFHMVYKGEAEDFSNTADIDPKYKNFAFQYVLTKEGTRDHAVEFFSDFDELAFPELNDHVAHARVKAQQTYGDRVRLSEVCSYKFSLDSNEKKVYYRVLLND